MLLLQLHSIRFAAFTGGLLKQHCDMAAWAAIRHGLVVSSSLSVHTTLAPSGFLFCLTYHALRTHSPGASNYFQLSGAA